MLTDSYRIMPGACGWLHPAWSESFYPEDLPAEWQLGFYGNEFPVVMLPASYWAEDDETIRAWLDDSSDKLAIIAEFSSLAQLRSNRQRLALLGDRCRGIVCKFSLADFLAEHIDQLPDAGVPLCIDPGDAGATGIAPEIRAELLARHIGLVWHGSGEPDGIENCPLALARIDSEGMNMRGLRHVIETLLNRTSPEQTVVLIFEGNPPDVQIIRNAIVMLDLF